MHSGGARALLGLCGVPSRDTARTTSSFVRGTITQSVDLNAVVDRLRIRILGDVQVVSLDPRPDKARRDVGGRN